MTREEIEKNRHYQLTSAAFDYCRKELPHYDGEVLGEITDAFEAGAEWEHKRLIEKACKWIDSIDFDMRYWNSEDGVCVGDFIEDLRKIMEE